MIFRVSDRMTGKRLAALVVMTLALNGCALPSAGPTVTQLERSTDPALDVYLVKVSAPVVRILSQYRSAAFPPAFRLENHKPTVALRPGDVIGVNIYETGGSPLFVGGSSGGGGAPGSATAQPTGGSQAATLPGQIIEPDGQILIPFVGRVPVANRTPTQAADEIARRLSAQTAKPQVIVTLLTSNANTATVGGEVNRAGLVPLTLRGEKLLDVISQAGGARFPATEVDIRIMRGNSVAAIPLQDVLSSPPDNILVKPNDSIMLVRNPKTFVVMGAALKVAQYNFDTERVTLAEGIARAGGTVDTIGNLAGIFLIRSEPTSLARAVLGADTKAVDASYVQTDETRLLTGPQTRMLYSIDLTQSPGYFFAQNILLRDKDIVLMANAETVQVQKAMTIIRGFTGAYFDLSRGAAFYYPQ